MNPPQPTLYRAPQWHSLCGWAPFTVGYAVHRQVVRLAAYRRNLRVDAVSQLYCTISDGSRTVAFWEHNPETTSRVARYISNSKSTSKAVLEQAGLPCTSGQGLQPLRARVGLGRTLYTVDDMLKCCESGPMIARQVVVNPWHADVPVDFQIIES